MKRHGLLDAALMIVLVYAVYAKTPLGALGETAVNIARGQKDHPSWISTFKGHETAVSTPEDPQKSQDAALGALPPAIEKAAREHKVDPEAVAALISTHGQCAGAVCDMEAPPKASAVLGSLAGKTRLSADDVAAALASAQKELENNSELAIESMWVGPIAARLAVEQARRGNVDAPTDVEAHADFYTP
ncbi:MAG TPA: hypothetical protein VGM56_02615, partial [Byssovorax sp.]